MDRVRKHFPDTWERDEERPPEPLMIDGQEEYEVEAIVGYQKPRGDQPPRYKIHWKGYSKEQDSWEDVDDLTHAAELVQNFYQMRKKTHRWKGLDEWLSKNLDPGNS